MDAAKIDQAKLRPCPFCGGAARVVRMHDRYPSHICQIACSNGKCAVGPRTVVMDTERAVIEWNSRPGAGRAKAAEKKKQG